MRRTILRVHCRIRGHVWRNLGHVVANEYAAHCRRCSLLRFTNRRSGRIIDNWV